jgi:hypothetical protein
VHTLGATGSKPTTTTSSSSSASAPQIARFGNNSRRHRDRRQTLSPSLRVFAAKTAAENRKECCGWAGAQGAPRALGTGSGAAGFGEGAEHAGYADKGGVAEAEGKAGEFVSGVIDVSCLSGLFFLFATRESADCWQGVLEYRA